MGTSGDVRAAHAATDIDVQSAIAAPELSARSAIAAREHSVRGAVAEREHHLRSTVAAREHDVRGAIIIPAHDESAVIGRTLRALAPLGAMPGIEIVVACNGCRDDTAAIARGYPGVRVIETERPSKTAALNLGDSVATAWPRLYLDADIEIAPSAVLAVFAALDEPGVLAARAPFAYDTAGASLPVRAYYRARSRIPVAVRLWGAGGYAMNEAGHRRVGEFPDVTADDAWVDEQFAGGEKRIVAASAARVRTPRDTAGLLAVLTRQRRGVTELGGSSEAASRGTALLAGIRGPRSAADAAWYVLLTLIGRRRSARQSGRASGWERDASSRVAAAT
ncbi:glycosyltransferase [Microbacterium sp. cx-55]|uniref:glycosyltransferase n=1 Tax=Microbacterium sp. cx-55 TaxID=2875948 RepID=UPI001CBD8A6D|nr:glycosyltransferase [Microbacterium sp. cx-55]MBZ4486894.1 glycosyltransferase [Microbacterium sp. cx-55]UGB35818.1 glycosyltransferase [Microbacterium sp. cx-55]